MPALGSDRRLTTSRRYVKYRRNTKASRGGVTSSVLRLCATSLCYVFFVLLDVFWFLLPPPHLRQRLLARPHFVQRCAFIQPPVLHHVMDLLGVVDVLERIRVEHDQVGQLAGLERAQVLVHSDAVRAVHRTDAERFAWRHPAARQGPELPVTPQPVELAVAPHTDVAAGPEHGGRGRGDARKHVLVLAEPRPALGPLVDLLVGDEAPNLRIVVDVVALVEVVL